MPFIKQEQDNRRLVAVIGFWSALLVAVLNIWFYIAYGLYQSIQFAPWNGLTDYAASFQPLPLLAWIFPTRKMDSQTEIGLDRPNLGKG